MEQIKRDDKKPTTSTQAEQNAAASDKPSNRMRNMLMILLREENRVKHVDSLPAINGEKEVLNPQEILLIDFVNFKDNQDSQKLMDDNFDGEMVVFGKNTLVEAWRKGLVRCENAPGNGLLVFMYGKGTLNAIIRQIAHLRTLTLVYGYYNSRMASEKRILNFIKNILHIDIGTSNVDEINNGFKHKFGKGIDEFTSINDIFARLYTPEYFQEIFDNAKPKEGDIINSATSRVRFYENVDIDRNFNLTNKNIGGHVNSFNVRRLLGGYDKDKDNGSGFENGYFKYTLGDYLVKLKESERKFEFTKCPQHKNRLVRKERYLLKKIAALCDRVLLHGLSHYVEGATMVVNRLAPIDYHNFHFPFSSGKILSRLQMAEKLGEKMEQLSLSTALKESYSHTINIIKEFSESSIYKEAPTVRIDGKYMSVNTHAITSKALDYNPLVENVREVLFIETDGYGIIPYVIIGASMVGGISLKIKAGDSLKMGDEMGHFEFGGSSVIMFVPGDTAIPYEHTRKLQNIYYEVSEGESAGTLREMEVYMPIGTPLFHQ